MHRSVELLAKLVDASYFSDALISAIHVSRVADGLVALRVEFSTIVENALSWTFNAIGQLEGAEMIATQADDLVVHATKSGLPEQMQKQEFFALHPIPPNAAGTLLQAVDNGTFTILVLARCSAVLDPAFYIEALQANTWLGCCAIKSAFQIRLPIPMKVGAGTHFIKQLPSRSEVVFMGGERMYGCRTLSSPAQHLVVRQFLGEAEVRPLNVDVSRVFEVLGLLKQDLYGTKMDTNLTLDVCTREPLTVETVLNDLGVCASRDTLAELSRKHIEAKQAATARALQQRAAEMTRRRHVRLVSGATRVEVGLEPSNENETIILTTRLEPELAKHFFGHFFIREYTGRDGIDSIVHYKRSAGEVARDVNAEFEFDFRNFFQHRHPLQQVDLIVCWRMPVVGDGSFKFGDGEFGKGELVGSIESFRNWMKVITFLGHSITIIPLSQMPNVVVD